MNWFGLAALFVALLTFPLPSQAEPDGAVVPGHGPWYVSMGVSVRGLQSAFDFTPPSGAGWSRFIAAPGHGDPGLFTGGRGAVVYDNGFVGGENDSFAGFGAKGRIDSADQISPASGSVNGNQNLVRTVSFQSLGYESGGSFLTTEDHPAGAGPSVQLGYRVGESMGTRFDFQTGWTSVSSESGTGSLVMFPVYQVTNTYHYDYIANPALALGIPGAIDGLDEFLLYDPAALDPFFGTGYEGPRRGEPQFADRPYAFAVAASELDTRLTEIPFALAAWRECGPLEIGFTGGTTLNVISYELSSELAWHRDGASAAVARSSWSSSGTHLKVGLFAGLSARLPLTPDRRIFFEASGSYRWVDPVHASAGSVDVEIDASSAEGRIGLGVVLD